MRALKKVAAAVSLFLASAMAEQSFIDSAEFEGRNLHVSEDPDVVARYERPGVAGLDTNKADH